MNMKNELITMDPDYIFFFTWGSLDLFLPQEKHYHESIIKKKLKKNIAGNKNSQICFTLSLLSQNLCMDPNLTI